LFEEAKRDQIRLGRRVAVQGAGNSHGNGVDDRMWAELHQSLQQALTNVRDPDVMRAAAD
jgi:hypothetical protein